MDDDGNQCKWCPEGEGDDKCGEHRQSPINLRRSPGVLGGDDEKECPDWHWMQFRDDTCTWDDMKNQFTIQRHALTINVPQMDNGEIDCYSEEKGRRYPRLDYSKGFPEWWWMQRTEIMVPSQHSQEGVHYAAEVVLAHFYEQDHYKNKVSSWGGIECASYLVVVVSQSCFLIERHYSWETWQFSYKTMKMPSPGPTSTN